MGKLVIFVTVFMAVHIWSSHAFLYNAPRALAGLASSASSSASEPMTPVSNIADLRRKAEKIAKLREEKDITQHEDVPNESRANMPTNADTNSEEHNEASPSILQKKVNKILTKLRLISQWKAQNDQNATSTKEIDEEDYRKQEEEYEQKKKNATEETESNMPKSTVVITKRNGKLPFKNNFYAKQIDENVAEEEEIENDTRFGNVGVFFMELLGTIVGLVYGAAAQFTNIQNQSAAIIEARNDGRL